MPPAVLSAPPTPLALSIALRRRWLLALTVATLAALLGAAAAWTLLPVTWRARSLLHIASNRPFILYETPEVRIDFASYQRSQVALVKSRLVLNAALEDPKVATLPIVHAESEPAAWLEKNLKVDFLIGPEIMSIALEGDDPKSMAVIVDAVRNAYMKEIVNKEHDIRMRRLEQLQGLYARYDQLLREKRHKLNELAETFGAKKSEALLIKQKFFYSHLESLERELLQLQSSARKAQIESQLAQSKHASLKQSPLPKPVVEERLKLHPELVKMEADIAAKQARLDSLSERLQSPENDPLYRAEKQAVASAAAELASRREDLRGIVEQKLREESLAQTKTALQTHKEQLTLMDRLEKTVEEQVHKQAADIEALSKGTISIEWLDEEIAHTADTHKRVGSQKEALQVEVDAPSRVSVLEDAYTIQSRDPASRLRITGLAGIGLFGLAMFGVAFVEFHARRVTDVRDIVSGLGLRLLGVLPQIGRAFLAKPVASQLAGGVQNLLLESINTTRTMLVHAAKQESLRVVMVTSALKGEGKTLVSSHLAISMVQAGFRTLLIDADLRRPSVHRLFDMPAGAGLSELLRGEAEMNAVLRPAPVAGLTVLTTGVWDPSLVHLLAQQRLPEILGQLRAMYDFIIIDSAPVLPTTDSLLIGQHTDGVLFAVLCDVSRLPTIHAANERMAMLGVPVLGAVVGGAAVDGYTYPTAAPKAAA
jgi:capsular exopolysaccharide synthesis family protein